MPTVCIMEFDREARHFQFLIEVNLVAMPAKGDKIVLNLGEEPEGFIFEVYDTHYTDHTGVDVNVIRRGHVTDYILSGFPDIT
jgi:hypothetical protein